MNKLNLDPIKRHELGIGNDLIGVVIGGKFRHVECFDTEENLVAAIENEDDNVVVVQDDDWKADAGPCDQCHVMPDEEQDE